MLDETKVWGIGRPRKKTDFVVKKSSLEYHERGGQERCLAERSNPVEKKSATNGRKPASSIMRYRLELFVA